MTRSLNPAREWEKLTLEERRALIKGSIARATVTPGRGEDRISVELA